MHGTILDVAAPGARQLIGRVRLTRHGLDVWFGDGLAYRMPIAELLERLDEMPVGVSLDDADVVEFRFGDGSTYRIPWDSIRYAADAAYRKEMDDLDAEVKVRCGQRVRLRREQAGLTQAELAKDAGIGRVTLNRIETGKQHASTETLQALAYALDLEFNQLLPLSRE